MRRDVIVLARRPKVRLEISELACREHIELIRKGRALTRRAAALIACSR
jgi:hypothetical protein